MVSLEQIRQLEERVGRAVELIRLLRQENHTLKRTLESSQARMSELEHLVSAFKEDQSKIEEGIRSAIAKLDSLEDDLERSDEGVRSEGEAGERAGGHAGAPNGESADAARAEHGEEERVTGADQEVRMEPVSANEAEAESDPQQGDDEGHGPDETPPREGELGIF